MSDAVAIAGRDLVKTFAKGSVRALDGVSLDIRANEIFTLLGPSGCGKTTLLNLIAGFETADHGSISLHGQRLDGLPPHKRPVNTVFQNYAVFPHLTVAANVAFALEMKRLPRRAIASRVAEMLTLVKLDGMAARRPSELSGGQLQRVALARALAAAPKVLLLDEPISALDLKLRTEMQVELKRLQAEVGITFIFVTHDQQEALAMSDRIAVMNKGRILQVATPEEIYERPTSRFVADFIGDTNLLDGEAIGAGRFRLAGGAELQTDNHLTTEHLTTGNRATLAVRPERTAFTAVGAGTLAGTVEHISYLGSDTTYHLQLANAGRFRVRTRNRDDIARAFKGDIVGIDIPVTAIRVLSD